MLDVAIVGAGPAGLSAAAALLRCRSEPLRVQVSSLSVGPICERFTLTRLQLRQHQETSVCLYSASCLT